MTRQELYDNIIVGETTVLITGGINKGLVSKVYNKSNLNNSCYGYYGISHQYHNYFTVTIEKEGKKRTASCKNIRIIKDLK